MNKFFIFRVVIFLFAIFFWKLDFFQTLDSKISLFINQNVTDNTWTYFWALFNKNFENYLNQALILLILLIEAFFQKKSSLSNVLLKLIICFFYSSIGILILNHFFVFDRLSPSFVIDNFNNMQDIFDDKSIKVYSTKSFPSGHAFVMIYWAVVSVKFFNKISALYVCIVSIFFCIPRIISGAHWLSDVIAGGMIADIYVYLLTNIGIFKYSQMLIRYMSKHVLNYIRKSISY